MNYLTCYLQPIKRIDNRRGWMWHFDSPLKPGSQKFGPANSLAVADLVEKSQKRLGREKIDSEEPRQSRRRGECTSATKRGVRVLSWRYPATEPNAGLQMRIWIEFKYQTFLNFRTFTVPWTFELTACLIPKWSNFQKMLHLGESRKLLVKEANFRKMLHLGESRKMLVKI